MAGEKGLDRIISYVDILEVPDAINWLRGEELLLTTGYSIKDKPEVQERLILELDKVNAAGIVIKLNRFLENIPEVMIKQANEVDLPIIGLPPDVPYIEVTHPLLKEILIRQNEERWISEKLKEILYSEYVELDELKKKLALLNCNIVGSKFIVLLIVSYNNSWHLKRLLKINNFFQDPSVIAGELNGNYVIILGFNSSEEWKEKVVCNFINLEYTNELKGEVICLISGLISDPLKITNRI
ncbi:MAG: PucR family transcriptional regulator ligand-binding domain-containing protein [Thermosediminibacteraceae bacterium]|nr:PucR family transcriptional regulator ligand-binding domain-containing protein [Thermosediminibacteraceae bacterium]